MGLRGLDLFSIG